MRTLAICLALAIVLLCPFASAQWLQTNCDIGIRSVTLSLALVGTNLFAGTAADGVFRSTNNGTSWTAVNEGLPRFTAGTTEYYRRILWLVVSGTDLFAGTSDYLGDAVVFLSTNNGTSWTAVNQGLQRYITCLATSGTNLFAGTYTDGVFLSTNGGTSWTAVNEGLPRLTYDTTRYGYIDCLLASGTDLFAGIDNAGVFLSTNNGTSWTAVNEGLPRSTYDTTGYYRRISCLVVSGTDLFAAAVGHGDVDAGCGVFRSTNNGTTWTAVNAGLAPVVPPDWKVNCLFVSGRNLFLSSTYNVVRSTNNGISWEGINNGLPYERWEGDNVVKCFASSGQYLFAGTAADGVFRSTNNGTSWSSTGHNGLTSILNSLASIGQNLFAGTLYGVFLSTDNGSNWTAVNTGLLQGEEYGDYVGAQCLAVSGTSLFAGTAFGVYRSTNYGTSWNSLDSGSTLGSVQSFATVGTNLFAATPHGVYRSTNDGALWTAVNTGLTNTTVATFAVAGTKLIAGTGSGVYVTTNNGTSWNGLDSASTLGSVQALAILDTNLFVGTVPRGVWRRPLSQITTSVGTVASQLPGEYLLSQNYPNPFNPSTTIKFELPKSSQVSLSVFDILGREVSVLVNERRESGVHEVKFDGSNLASGVYFYRIEAGSFVETRKLILLR